MPRRDDAGRSRTTRAVAGAVVATVVAVLGGILVVRPDVLGGGADDRAAGAGGAATPGGPSSGATSGPVPVDQRLPTADDLLPATALGTLGTPSPGNGRAWRVLGADGPPAQGGPAGFCRPPRPADPRALGALVRRFSAPGTPGTPRTPSRTATQTVEVSSTAARAAAAAAASERRYAGCPEARVQLLATHRLVGVGREGLLLTLRRWSPPVTTYAVVVARTRAVTTSTVVATVGGAAPGPAAMTRLAAASVTRLCARAGAPACVRGPAYRVTPPPPTGGTPGLLDVLDLPPAGRVDRPWVGTRTTTLRADPPATRCDRAGLLRGGATRARGRTFLVPQATLPARFGLAEAVGTFPDARRARRFVAGVRAAVDGCEDRDPATEVGRERRRPRPAGAAGPALDTSAWDLRTRVSDTEEVRFRLGLVRAGRFVARVSLTPVTGADLTTAAYDALLVRAGDRLRELG